MDGDGARLLVHADLGRAHRHLPEGRAAAERRRAAPRRHDAAPDQLAPAHAEPLREELGVGQTRSGRDHGGVFEPQRGRVDAEVPASDTQELLAHVGGRLLHGLARHGGRAARARGLVVGRDRGVRHGHEDALHGHRQHLGGDLRHHRACALSHLHRAREHGHAGIGVEAHDGLGDRGRDARLHHHGETAPPTGERLLRPADGLGGAVEALLELAVDGRVSRRELLPLPEQVLPAEIDGIVTEVAGRLVDERLEGPRELRHAEAAERAPGRRVGVDGFRVEDDVGHPVRSRGRVRAFLDDARPDVGIGAHVEIGATLGGPQPPVALEAEPHPSAGVAASDRPEGLLHREGEPDGLPDHARERPHDGLELGVGLAAEAAAEGRDDDADAAHGHAEHLGQLHAHGVRILRRGPHGQGALLVPSRERRVRLHGIVLHARESVDILHDDVRPREGMRALPALEMELVADVGAGPGLEGGEIGEVAGQRLGRVNEGGAGSERLLQSGHGRQLLVRDLDQLEGLGGGALALGDHGGHGLALVARDLDGEDGAVAEGRTVVRMTTARTPAAARARPTSTRRIFAWGYGERSSFAWSVPGSSMSVT